MWWKEGVIYQIYPRSFRDSNGDGIGDLRGIIEKLDYIKSLGVDIIWLNPIYQSPNDDNGYDISDYYNVMTAFGTMQDFDELLEGMHKRGLRLLMDLVVNHCSDEHHWFQEAKKSKDNPYRDYFIWKKPKANGEPPNNWWSFFGGKAWEYDETTGEFYLHLFSKKQPDLNWENPKVREEVYQLMRFWLDKGVDGFRMDVIPFISKRLDFPDVHDFENAIVEVYANGPRIHEFLQEMTRETLSNYDAMSVGEGIGILADFANDYVGKSRNELNMIFHFDHMLIGYGEGGKFDPVPYKLTTFKAVFKKWYDALGEEGWVNIYLDNHDFPRMISRFANDGKYHSQAGKLLATLLMTQRGTPSIYYGSEIGMTNVAFDSIEDYRDIETLNFYKEAEARGEDMEKFLKIVHTQGRDNARTPMQWNAKPHAGFTTGTPWIKVNPNYPSINVEAAEEDPDSILHYYRKIIQFRKEHPTLIYGKYEVLDNNSEELFIYKRWDEEKTFLVLLNFSDEKQEIDLPFEPNHLIFRISNVMSLSQGLQPWEARIYEVKA